MRDRRPWRPSPRFDITDAALELSCRFSEEMVGYVGKPTIGSIVGWGKVVGSRTADMTAW